LNVDENYSTIAVNTIDTKFYVIYYIRNLCLEWHINTKYTTVNKHTVIGGQYG